MLKSASGLSFGVASGLVIVTSAIAVAAVSEAHANAEQSATLRIVGRRSVRAARPRGVAFLKGRASDTRPSDWANFIEILIVLYRLFRLSASSGDSGPPRTAAAVRDASGSNVEIVRM